jgi:hypothetical protein
MTPRAVASAIVKNRKVVINREDGAWLDESDHRGQYPNLQLGPQLQRCGFL